MKITDKIKDKFWNHEKFKLRHDEIKVTKNEVFYSYRNNTIAKYNIETKKLMICTCGWETVTTKSRLNTILDNTNSYIIQKQGIWYIVYKEDNTKILWDGDWFTFDINN